MTSERYDYMRGEQLTTVPRRGRSGTDPTSPEMAAAADDARLARNAAARAGSRPRADAMALRCSPAPGPPPSR